jgi:hypothetical protein
MKIKKIVVGWREWLALPDLGVERIIAKVDTGAKTCALHAFYIDEFVRDDAAWIKFGLHPNRDDNEQAIDCEAPVKERRDVTDSGGHTENRYVIDTTFVIAGQQFTTEVTLTNRDNMRYRLLLGRNALRRRMLVDPGKSFMLTRVAKPKQEI